MKWLMLLAAAALLGGCIDTETVDPGECPYPAPVISNATGLLHGIACNSNADCKYGTCLKNAMQQGGASTVGVCTKQCSCGGATSQCSNDDDSTKGLTFTCIVRATGAGKECGLTCTSDAFCQSVNPAQPFCVASLKGVFSAGARKVCAAKKDP